MSIKKDMVHQGEVGREGTLTPGRKHVVAGFMTGGVCKKNCNGGWMSTMETRVMPFLLDLISEKRRLEDLSSAEENALALWAVKTAYSFNHGSSASFRVPLEHLRQLATDPASIPDGVGVFACIHPGTHRKAFDFVQAQGWVGTDDRAKNPGSYKLCLRFGHLLLLTAYWPSEEDCLMYERSTHRPLAVKHTTLSVDLGLKFSELKVLDGIGMATFVQSLGVLPGSPISIGARICDSRFLEAYKKGVDTLVQRSAMPFFRVTRRADLPGSS